MTVVEAVRSDDHRIHYWTETVDQRLEVCNPTNADLAVSSAPGKMGVAELNTGGNICVRKPNGTYAHLPYVNRLNMEREDPMLFKGPGPWLLTLARIYPELTPSVVRAQRLAP